MAAARSGSEIGWGGRGGKSVRILGRETDLYVCRPWVGCGHPQGYGWWRRTGISGGRRLVGMGEH